MTLNRRSFIGAILAAGVAPAIVRADSLMRIITRDTYIDPIFHTQWDRNGVAGPVGTCGLGKPPTQTGVRIRLPVAIGGPALWVPSDGVYRGAIKFEALDFEGKDMAEVEAKIAAYKQQRMHSITIPYREIT